MAKERLTYNTPEIQAILDSVSNTIPTMQETIATNTASIAAINARLEEELADVVHFDEIS